MKALLLAAGRGTRLRPLTDTVPKCLVPVAGKPTLVRAIELLREQGVTDLIVNLHHRPEAVVDAIGDGGSLGVRVAYSFEPELLGTAGALDPCRDRLGDSRFLVVFADNVFACDLGEVVALHERLGAALTMTLHHRDDVRASGWADVDGDGVVRRFVEKPESPEAFGGWVNAGLLVCEPRVLEAVPRGVASDLGRDVVPALLGANETVGGYRLPGSAHFLWIDTPADLERAERLLGQEEAVA
ncbi:MAG TPA: nucleotidyltransferase family protein [Gaiellaceae bacterium]|nr:nucleotidyltransferase family protein [Gaiellaceae bacterium]